ncbi:hypothetical protein CY0110_19237 [Crocosphaera chwakensis CCY0110]|uniref:Uncharacterized protein n=1 Tax=Crocosphaera chwakensis CCY0110 TaxID=391612 RepID=A3IJH9_9CHRO|nr:hypothetical protein CY0110_19237 [Crocosphaera chwakensis CCY0110]
MPTATMMTMIFYYLNGFIYQLCYLLRINFHWFY